MHYPLWPPLYPLLYHRVYVDISVSIRAGCCIHDKQKRKHIMKQSTFPRQILHVKKENQTQLIGGADLYLSLKISDTDFFLPAEQH